MTTKKVTILVMIALITSLSVQVFGQKGEKMRAKKEKLETERVTFYNNYLKLTPTEIDKFWPLHKAYNDKLKETKLTFAKKNKTLRSKSVEDLTKEESAELMKSQFELKQSLLDLEKEYATKFQSAISIQKVTKLKEAEAHFKKDILQKARAAKREKRLENRSKTNNTK